MKPGSLLQLARWEARRLMAERTGLALLALWCLLLALAAGQGVAQVRARHTAIRAALAADRTVWSERRAELADIEAGRSEPKPFRDPRSPTNSVMGLAGERPLVLQPAPLAALTSGSGDLAPAVRRVGMLTKLFVAPESIENPANRLAGPLDLLFVTAALLPLFVLALSFDVLARERDAGILPLLASQPVTLGRIVAARLAVHAVSLWLPLALAATAAVLFTRTPEVAVFHVLGELALWLLLSALYLAFWQMLAAALNFRGSSAASNAVVLCGLWLAAIILVPSGAQVAVQALAPLPDRREFVLQVRAIETDLFKRAEEIRDAYYAAGPGRRPAVELNEYDTYYVQNLWPRALAADDALAPAIARVEQARSRQAAWWRRLAWVSPALAFRLGTEQLAGVTPVQQGALAAAARDFQRRWRGHFGAKLSAMQRLTPADYDTKPEPPSLLPPFRERLVVAWPALLGLLAAILLTAFILLRPHAHRRKSHQTLQRRHGR